MTLEFLVRSIWVEREAVRRGLALSQHELRGAVRNRERQFSGTKHFDAYLNQVGITRRQFRWRVRRDKLMEKVMFAAMNPKLRVSRTAVRRYYSRHQQDFWRPVARLLSIIVTRTRWEAGEARTALAGGRSWGAVVRTRSIDPSKDAGGRVAIDRSNTISKLRRAVFDAPLHVVQGPVRIKGVWWLFRVERERPSGHLPRQAVAAHIRSIIRSEREQRAMERLLAQLRRRYHDSTICRDPYQSVVCRDSLVLGGANREP